MTDTRERAEKNVRAFTDLGLKRLKPPKQGQELYWDKSQKGLALLVSSGGTKTFRSTYKLNGRWLSRSIGRFGEMVANADPDKENVNIGAAREIVVDDRAMAKKGIDPKALNQPQPGAKLTYEFVVEQFMEHYAKPRQRTWPQTERALKNNFKDWLKRPIDSITKQDVRAKLRGFIADGHPHKAANARAWLKKLWRWAFAEDLVAAPIMEAVSIEVGDCKVRNRIYSDDEIKSIWQAADQLDVIEGAYSKLLVLLAPRKTALALLERSHLDDVDNPTLWTTPFELTKSRKRSPKKRTYLTPLPPLAQRIIKGLPSHDGEERLFPGLPMSNNKGGQREFNDRRLNERLIEHGAPKDYYPHAMRHTLATWLQNESHSEWEIGLILNHSSSGVTAGYSHGYPLGLKHQLLCKWADHVEGLVTAEGVRRLR